MSYDDLPHNQQFYMQRIQSQPQQGMAIPITQHNNQLPLNFQQPTRQPYGMIQQPQQIMVRMPSMPDDHYQQQQYRDFVHQNMPQNMQSQVNSEREPDRRRQLQAVKQQHEIYEQQMGIRLPMGMSPHRMPISQVQGMMYANNGQQMVQQPIQRAPSQTSFAQMSAQPQQIQQVYMSNQIRQPMHSIPIAHQYVQQQHFQQQQQQQSQLTQMNLQQQQHPQLVNKQSIPTGNIQTATSQRNIQGGISASEFSIGAVNTTQIRKTQSSQIIQQLSINQSTEENHKSNVENAQFQSTPEQSRSTGTPQLLNVKHHNETENPDYKLLLEQLRTYKLDVKQLLARMELDNIEKEVKLRSMLYKVLNVMDGNQKGVPVTRELLRKLIENVKTVLGSRDIAKNLFNVTGNLSKIAMLRDFSIITKEVISAFGDPWKNVRHAQIRVPEHVSKIIKKNESNRESMNIKKRPRNEDSGEEPPFKRNICS